MAVRDLLLRGSRSICFLPAILLLTGCVLGTSKPLYDAKRDVVFDVRLMGEWVPDYPMHFSRGPSNAYHIIGRDLAMNADKKDSGCLAHLVPIGKYRYLFFTSPDFVGTLLFPCYRVELSRGRLILRLLNVGKIADDLREHPGTLKFEEKQPGIFSPTTQITTQPATLPSTRPATEPAQDGFIVLTDEPKNIRAYLIRHQDDPDYFTEPVVFRRVKGLR